MPIVSEFIRLCRNFSTITLIPERVVNFGCSPVVIGIVRTSLPSRKTFIWWVWMLTLLTIDRATAKETLRSSWP